MKPSVLIKKKEKSKKSSVSALKTSFALSLLEDTHSPYYFLQIVFNGRHFFFFTDLTLDIFTAPQIEQWANKKLHVIRKANPILRKLHRYAMFLSILLLVFFFFLPRSISTNTNYGTVSQHAVRISVRLLGKENIHSLSCTCLFILFAHNWNCIEITQKSFTQKVTCSQMILICLKMKLTLKGKE